MAATTTLNSTSHSWQTNLQGLRAVAILAVLLFHASSNQFAQGYLGVDIFFVISGFLMCLLLNAKAPLSMVNIGDFYFRLFFISPTDYRDLRKELSKPLLFLSNVPNNDHQNYFVEAREKGYQFFVHLWSLSVELQLYLIVPFLILLLHQLAVSLQLLVIIAIATSSFYTQIYSRKDAEHIATYNRLWQFMSGFTAFYLQKIVEHQPRNYLELVDEENGKIETSKVQESGIAVSCFRWALKLIGMMLPLLLLFVLYSPLSNRKAVNRLTIVRITTLIIGVSETSVLLSNSLVVAIGDISYSVYLVHFMLFKYYDYEFIILIYKEVNILVVVGIVLIAASILVGWMMECTFKNLNPRITKWSTLLLLISGLYVAIGLTLLYLKTKEINLDIEKEFEIENPEHVMNKAIQLYEHSKSSPLNLTVDEQIFYNQMFYPAALNLWYCEEKEQLPSSYVGGGSLRNNSCTIRGNGTKHIVVLGTCLTF
ncbi:O-ACyltransferase-like protein [Aphelenchoides besseyi]|nr:O-ACyltransferase-like protein [Aphelenchoides besseyi]